MSSSPLAAASGVSTGINWNSIISAMLMAQEQPLIALQGQQSVVTQKQQVYTSLEGNLTSLQTSAQALSSIGGQAMNNVVGNSTNDAVATATANAGAMQASETLQVTALATSAQAQSASTVMTSGTSATAPQDTSSANITTSTSFDPTQSLSTESPYLATAPGTGGTITVNGASINWTSSDSLDTILGMINSASVGVTAAYNATTGEVSLTGGSTGSTSTLTLGQTSGNLLSVLNLTAGTVSGTNATSFDPTATLASQASSMKTAVTAGTFSLNGVVFQVTPSTDSLDSVMQAINSSNAGVQAVFNAQTGILSLSSTAQGSSAALTLGASGDTSNFLAAFNMGTVTAGQNAQVSVNGGAAQSLSSNSSTTLLPGGTVNLTGLGSATVSVGPSAADAASAVQTFVTAFNSAVNAVSGYLDQAPANSAPLTGLPTTQAPNANPSIQGAFIGNSLLQQTVQSLVDQVLGTQISGGSITQLSQIGISLTVNANGQQPPTLSFNQSAFEAAFNSDPTAVNGLISNATTGLAPNLYNTLQGLVNPATGSYTNEISGETSTLGQLGKQISTMQANLNYQQQSLTAQFGALEGMLAKMKAQGSQISGTLNTLSTAG